jgi:hypothetical protein
LTAEELNAVSAIHVPSPAPSLPPSPLPVLLQELPPADVTPATTSAESSTSADELHSVTAVTPPATTFTSAATTVTTAAVALSTAAAALSAAAAQHSSDGGSDISSDAEPAAAAAAEHRKWWLQHSVRVGEDQALVPEWTGASQLTAQQVAADANELYELQLSRVKNLDKCNTFLAQAKALEQLHADQVNFTVLIFKCVFFFFSHWISFQ